MAAVPATASAARTTSQYHGRRYRSITALLIFGHTSRPTQLFIHSAAYLTKSVFVDIKSGVDKPWMLSTGPHATVASCYWGATMAVAIAVAVSWRPWLSSAVIVHVPGAVA